MKKLEKHTFARVWITCFVLLSTLCVYGLFTQTKETYSAVTIKGKWQWNDCIDISFFPRFAHTIGYTYVDVNFNSASGKSHAQMIFSDVSVSSSGRLNYDTSVAYDDGNNNGGDGGLVIALFAFTSSRYYDGIYYSTGTKNGKNCHYFFTDDGYGLGYDPEPLFTTRSKTTYSVIDFGASSTITKVQTSSSSGAKADASSDSPSAFYNWFIQNATRIDLKVTYNSNGGTGTMNVGTVARAGNSYTVSQNRFTAPSGKQFVKWCTKADGTGNCYQAASTMTVSDDVTLYAIWGGKNTITYHDNDGDGSDFTASDEVNFGESYTIREYEMVDFDKFHLVSWNTKPDGTGQTYRIGQVITVNSNLDLYGIYKNIYEITYNPNGGTGSRWYWDSIIEGERYTVRSNEFNAPSGKEFDKWCTSSSGNGTCYNVGQEINVTSRMNLYAIWKTILVPCSISYNANGGSGTMASSTGKYVGDRYSVKKNMFVSPGNDKKFYNWNTKADGSGTSYNANNNLTCSSDTTLYAIWREYYTVTYEANGGSGAPATQGKYRGLVLTLSNITPTPPDGYSFKYWYDGTNTYAPGAKYTKDQSIILKAIYEKNSNNSYTIIYSANGGDSAPTPTIHNGKGTISLQYPIRFGYEFIGWQKDPSKCGSKVDYKIGDSFKLKEDIKLYACWKQLSNTNRCELRSNPETNDKHIIALVVLIVSVFAWMCTYFILKKAK